MQQRKENTAVSARPAEMCLCKDAAKRKGGTPLRFMQEHSHRHAVLRIRQARDCFFFFLQPLKLISGKKYWRSHLDRHAGCDVRCTGLAQALGIGMRTGMTLERRSLRCRYIFSQVSCFLFFLQSDTWSVRRGFAENLGTVDVRGYSISCLLVSNEDTVHCACRLQYSEPDKFTKWLFVELREDRRNCKIDIKENEWSKRAATIHIW